MINQIKFFHLKPNQINKFKKFISDNHSKKHILAQSKEVIDWFYKDFQKYNFIIAVQGKNILGVQGYIPLSKFDKKIKKSCFLAYWRVKVSKNIGVGLRIFEKIQSKKFMFMGVLGINNELMKYHKWQGFNVGKLNHHFFANKNFVNKRIIKKKFYNKFVYHKIDLIRVNKKNLKFLSDVIFKNQYPIKTKIYLKNRYLKNNFYKYQIYNLTSGKVNLVIIFRIIEFQKSRIIKIVDLIGKEKQIRFIGSALEKLLQKYDCEYMDFYSFGIKEENLKKAGFINRYETDEIIPDYFEPFERRNIDINYAYISNKKNNIRLVKGDGDMDRPSQLNKFRLP